MGHHEKSELRAEVQELHRELLEVLATDRLSGRVKERLRRVAADLIGFSHRLEAAWDGPPSEGTGTGASLWGLFFDLLAQAWSLLTGYGDDNPTNALRP